MNAFLYKKRSVVVLVGLVRVSTNKQETARQHDALDGLCVKVFEEKISGSLGVDARPALSAAIDYLRPPTAPASTLTRPMITATADGEGVVSHAGSRLLADVADRTTLTAQLAEVLAGLRKPRARHDPGRVLVDMAVAVADGATTISDVAVLADQAELFGSVASDSTCLAAARSARRRAARCGRAGSGGDAGGRVGAARRADRAAVPAGKSGRPGAAGVGDRSGRLDRGVSQNWHWHKFLISRRAVTGRDGRSRRVATFKVRARLVR